MVAEFYGHFAQTLVVRIHALTACLQKMNNHTYTRLNVCSWSTAVSIGACFSRSRSWDDVNRSLAWSYNCCEQGGFTGESKFAFIPLEGDPMVGIKKSASNDDMQALAEVQRT